MSGKSNVILIAFIIRSFSLSGSQEIAKPPILFGQPRELDSDKLGSPLNTEDFKTASKLNSGDQSLISDDPSDGRYRPVDPIELAGRFEGDIIIDTFEEYQRLMSANETYNISMRNAIIKLEKRWPKGEIPYVISSSFDLHERAMIANAIALIHNNTCIRFVQKKNHKDYIHLLKGLGCSSSVGRQGGAQVVSLGEGCFHNKGIVMHELMHTTGFWHEHSRGDRDAYIQIVEENIKSGLRFNFNKYDWSAIQSLGIEYDLRSIMHYGPYAFAKDRSKPTIIPRQRIEIGQRRNFSKRDIQKMNLLYNCVESGGNGNIVTPRPLCTDSNPYCKAWAALGECVKNSSWMRKNCPRSCKHCGTPPECKDTSVHCSFWAKNGDCKNNPNYMLVFCQSSCNSCL